MAQPPPAPAPPPAAQPAVVPAIQAPDPAVAQAVFAAAYDANRPAPPVANATTGEMMGAFTNDLALIARDIYQYLLDQDDDARHTAAHACVRLANVSRQVGDTYTRTVQAAQPDGEVPILTEIYEEPDAAIADADVPTTRDFKFPDYSGKKGENLIHWLDKLMKECSARAFTHQVAIRLIHRHTQGVAADCVRFALRANPDNLEKLIREMEVRFSGLSRPEHAQFLCEHLVREPGESIVALQGRIRHLALLATRLEPNAVEQEEALKKKTLLSCLSTSLRLELRQKEEQRRTAGLRPTDFDGMCILLQELEETRATYKTIDKERNKLLGGRIHFIETEHDSDDNNEPSTEQVKAGTTCETVNKVATIPAQEAQSNNGLPQVASIVAAVKEILHGEPPPAESSSYGRSSRSRSRSRSRGRSGRGRSRSRSQSRSRSRSRGRGHVRAAGQGPYNNNNRNNRDRSRSWGRNQGNSGFQRSQSPHPRKFDQRGRSPGRYQDPPWQGRDQWQNPPPWLVAMWQAQADQRPQGFGPRPGPWQGPRSALPSYDYKDYGVEPQACFACGSSNHMWTRNRQLCIYRNYPLQAKPCSECHVGGHPSEHCLNKGQQGQRQGPSRGPPQDPQKPQRPLNIGALQEYLNL